MRREQKQQKPTRQAAPTPSGPRPARSAPQGIVRPDRKQVGGAGTRGNTYGSSYTEKHLLERDFLLENVVKRTQHSFLDVSSKPAEIDEKEAVERVQKYASMQFQLGKPPALVLPKPCRVEAASVIELLREAPGAAEDDFSRASSAALRAVQNWESRVRVLTEGPSLTVKW